MDKEELILKNLDLARKIAWQIVKSNRAGDEGLEEIIGVAYLGLCIAAKNFKPERGAAFTTFAYRHITGEIFSHLRGNGLLSRASQRHIRLETGEYPHLLSDTYLPEPVEDPLLLHERLSDLRQLKRVSRTLPRRQREVFLHLVNGGRPIDYAHKHKIQRGNVCAHRRLLVNNLKRRMLQAERRANLRLAANE